MKKVLSLLIMIVFTFTMTACGSQDVPNNNKKEDNDTPSVNIKDEVSVNPVQKVFHTAAIANYVTITVDPSIKMDDESYDYNNDNAIFDLKKGNPKVQYLSSSLT